MLIELVSFRNMCDQVLIYICANMHCTTLNPFYCVEDCFSGYEDIRTLPIPQTHLCDLIWSPTNIPELLVWTQHVNSTLSIQIEILDEWLSLDYIT
jgi:hypothetical protein